MSLTLRRIKLQWMILFFLFTIKKKKKKRMILEIIWLHELFQERGKRKPIKADWDWDTHVTNFVRSCHHIHTLTFASQMSILQLRAKIVGGKGCLSSWYLERELLSPNYVRCYNRIWKRAMVVLSQLYGLCRPILFSGLAPKLSVYMNMT